MTKEDFIDWKSNPVTKEIYRTLEQRVHEIQELLGDTAGLNSLQDREYVGAIKAYRDVLDIQYEEETE